MIITAPGFKALPRTVTEICETPTEDLRPVFSLYTADNLYKANTLGEVLRLWKETDDDSAVKSLIKEG